jgi:hypothetical protein
MGPQKTRPPDRSSGRGTLCQLLPTREAGSPERPWFLTLAHRCANDYLKIRAEMDSPFEGVCIDSPSMTRSN